MRRTINHSRDENRKLRKQGLILLIKFHIFVSLLYNLFYFMR